MRIKTAVLGGALLMTTTPAWGLDDLTHLNTEPRAIAAFEFRERAIEISAVTRRKRADTPVRRAYMEECRAMGKVLPGYPQPAFVSFDIRLKF